VSDARAMMRYDAEKKSLIVAYLLWFFLGYGGVHRMYLGRWISGLLMLLIFGVSTLLSLVYIGFVGLGFIFLWWLLDALLTAAMVRGHNARLAAYLSR
jgi:TM2 domain-containing membrane protein YozV